MGCCLPFRLTIHSLIVQKFCQQRALCQVSHEVGIACISYHRLGGGGQLPLWPAALVPSTTASALCIVERSCVSSGPTRASAGTSWSASLLIELRLLGTHQGFCFRTTQNCVHADGSWELGVLMTPRRNARRKSWGEVERSFLCATSCWGVFVIRGGKAWCGKLGFNQFCVWCPVFPDCLL